MKETVDTLGNQKKVNYALQAHLTKEDFIKEVTDGLLPPPQYFPLNVKMNKQGYEDIDTVLNRGTSPLDVATFEALVENENALVLDVRHQNDFVNEHIPQSIFIGIDGGFAPWVGAMIQDVQQPIVLVCPEGREEETVTRLSRVGFDRTLGFLKGGLAAWKAEGKETDSLRSISAAQFEEEYKTENPTVVDVRKEGEYQSQHMTNAFHAPLDYINLYLNEMPSDAPFYVHCAGGYRSVIAASVLKKRGIHNLVNVEGGFKAILDTGLPITDYVCPSTL